MPSCPFSLPCLPLNKLLCTFRGGENIHASLQDFFFSRFFLQSTYFLYMYSCYQHGRASPYFLCEVFPTPAASQSVRLLHSVSVLLHHLLLNAPQWVVISLIFPPIFSTRHKSLKGKSLACPPAPDQACHPQLLMPCLK